MQTVPVQLDVPKEGKDVADLLDGILEKVMAKEGLASYTDLLDELMVAVDGVGAIGDEVKTKYRSDLAAYMSKILMDRLMPVSEPET